LKGSKPGPIVTLSNFGILWRDQDDAVAEQIDRGGSLISLLADCIILPVGVGGTKISAGAPCSICLPVPNWRVARTI